MSLLLARIAQAHRGGVAPGGDPYWSNVVSLLHFDGANGSTTFTDAAGKTAWTGNGGAALSTAQSKFGGSALLLNGSSGYLTAATPAAINLSTGDLTIEAWVYLKTVASVQTLLATWTTSSAVQCRSLFNSTATLELAYSNSNVHTAGGVITANVWRHTAFVRKGSSVYLFVDGVLVGSGTLAPPASGSTGRAEIGRNWENNAWFLNGYIDEFRVTQGVARYTENFTPPTAAFPSH